MVRAVDDGLNPGGAEHLKVPPNSIEAEQSLIGGLMLNKAAWDKVADVVSESDFYRQDHQLIFTAIARLVEAGNPCDVVTISEYPRAARRAGQGRRAGIPRGTCQRDAGCRQCPRLRQYCPRTFGPALT